MNSALDNPVRLMPTLRCNACGMSRILASISMATMCHSVLLLRLCVRGVLFLLVDGVC